MVENTLRPGVLRCHIEDSQGSQCELEAFHERNDNPLPTAHTTPYWRFMRAVDFIIADIRDNAYARREEDMAEDPDPNGWATKTESEIHALVLDDMANFTTDAYSQLGAEVPVGTTPLANGGWIPPSKNDDVSCNCAGRCTDSNGCPCQQIDCPDDECGQIRGCLGDCTCAAGDSCD